MATGLCVAIKLVIKLYVQSSLEESSVTTLLLMNYLWSPKNMRSGANLTLLSAHLYKTQH